MTSKELTLHHLKNARKVVDQTRELLGFVNDLDLRELFDAHLTEIEFSCSNATKTILGGDYEDV